MEGLIKAVVIVATSWLWYKTRRGFANDYRLILTRADTGGGVPGELGCLLGYVEVQPITILGVIT